MTWGYVTFLLGSLGLLTLVVFAALRTARLLQHWRPDRNLLLLPAENLLRGILMAVAIGLGIISGLPPERLGWMSHDPAGDIAWGIALGGALAAAIHLGTRRLVQRPNRRLYDTFIMYNITPRSPAEWPAVLAALLLAVTVEELIFRSLLLGGLVPPLPFWPLAVILAICFGIVHRPQGWLAVVVTATAGLLFAWLFLTRHSLLAPLLAHYTADALQLGLAYTRRDLAP
ncbi:MAG: CPBP family intramembrane metalloprotease [Anaerolineae bacterium]|nr:CPBP family intramembrane metalloprotease [Anaerolineae bacterium]